MGFQGASLAAHQREIKVEDDERGQEERRPQVHLANDKPPGERAAGRKRGLIHVNAFFCNAVFFDKDQHL